MKQCCVENSTHKFCPDCGARIISTPLDELLKYCLSRVKDAKRQYAKYENWATSHNEPIGKGAGKWAGERDKWQAFADALMQVEYEKP